MGDRTTPMKFGPEWLRNLSREPTSPGAQSPTTPIRPVTLNATASNTAPNTSKVLLAKLRYGREEMLALYDKHTAEAPLQLRSIDLLYQARGKVPYALNVNFEDDTRDINMRNNPPIGAMSATDRYGQSRGRGISVSDGRGRGIPPPNESRGRSRGYVRQASSGRNPNWHNGGPRSYPGIPDDDPNPPRGLWNNGNPINLPGIRLPTEQSEWNNKAPYRKNRQNHTNWRQQQNRDEGEEWRSSDGARRGQEKWEREWPERNNQEKPWTTNRRQWGGDNEDALPEWAVDNTENCGGTFDSSGAFHGYSNDDTNLPKAQESYLLTRSNTHGSFARSRTVDEESDEWWASEKAKKLSTKRFDAVEVKFKKPSQHFTPGISEENAGGKGNVASAATTNTGINSDVGPPREKSKLESIKHKSATTPTHDLQDEAAAFPAKHDDEKQKDRAFQTSYAENPPTPSVQKRIEMLLRTEELETSNERGNYKSVMMTPNNNHLRQKHQNIGAPTNEPPKRIASLFESTKQQVMQNRESDEETQQKQQETKLVEDILDMNLNDELQAQLLNATTQTAGMAKQMSSSGMQMRMNNPLLNQGMGMSQQNLNMAVSQGMPQGSMMRPMGITNSMLNASLGLPMGTNSNMGMPLTSMPSISNPQMLSSNAQMLSSNPQNMMSSNPQMLSSNPQMLSSNPQMLSSNSQMLSSNSQMLSSNAQMLSSNPQNMMSSNPQMLSSNLQSLGGNMQNPMQGMQTGLQPGGMQTGLQPGGMQTGLQPGGMQTGLQPGGMQTGLQPGGMQMGGLQSGMQGNGYQPSSGNMQMPGNMQSGMNSSNLQAASGIPGFQGVGNSSLFMQGSPNTMQNPNDMAMHGQQNMYPMHGHSLQQSASQNSFNGALYSNMMQPPPAGPMTNVPLTEQWYYEDPKKTIQGPFTSKEMYNWYRAGFFNPDLMVRRACETGLRPLATYGIMPFGPMSLFPPQFNQMPTRFDMQQQASHDNNMINAQQAGLGPEVESLWSQPANDMLWMQPSVTPRDDNNRVNNLSMYLWDQPSGMSNSLLPGPITKDMKTEDDILAQMRATHGDPAALNLSFMPDTLSPEDAFTAGTNIAPNLEELQKLIGSDIHVSAAPRGPTTADAVVMDAAAIAAIPTPPQQHPRTAAPEKEKKTEKAAKAELVPEVSAKQPAPIKTNETKPAKQPAKVEEKQAKTKEVVTSTKAKTKKQKDEKKEDDIKVKDEEKKTSEKRFEELLPVKNKKEDKAKKELDKEKKEWLKDGFTIVKGTEKKETRKREKEEARLAEEAEKKRIEDEKRAFIEAEKNRAPEPVTRRQQMEIGQSQRQQSQQAAEAAPKKAPWSAQSSGRDGLALSDIQRLEREKKLEQMKEQQQMMHAIAQQQAVAAHRDQEIQAGQLGWAKKKQSNNLQPGHSLAEIQAEARLQAATIAAAATAAASEENLITPAPVTVTPWGASNGGGFWDSPAPIPTSSVMAEGKSGAGALGEVPKAESKPKKKVTVVPPSKKEASPSADFEIWCINVLSNWSDAANIDIPTFIAFLRDIESPYEVKDYVKCYLGDTKDSIDFSRQFLERRSRLLRVGMVTPSDDLCSPAVAINPRTNSGSDYTEVKSKGKKTKKNKMFKVDSRILGFSVTAAEDRINIGDIDTV